MVRIPECDVNSLIEKIGPPCGFSKGLTNKYFSEGNHNDGQTQDDTFGVATQIQR